MKSWHQPNDLALLGAPPAFAAPLHVGRPNVGRREDLMRRIEGILDRRWFSNAGPVVKEFEQRIQQLLGVRHCIAMCNGTVALEIAIRALGLKDEVIVPSYTFIATAHALQWQGITPVFADIDPATHNLDPRAVEARITPRTTGIIGVHLWGRPCPTEALQELADRRGLALMYDASHAFSCTHGGKRIGNFGRAEVFSFHATKFLHTFEGGAVTTNDDELAARIRLMKNFGFAGYDNVVHVGANGKMPEICAAMGLTGLDSLEEFLAVNRRNHALYREELAQVPGLQLIRYPESDVCNHQYVVVEVQPGFPVRRDDLIRILHAENVLARKYFWPGCHNMQPYRTLYPDAGRHLPATRLVADRVIVLPTGTAMAEDDIRALTRLLAFVAARGAELQPHFAREVS